MDMNFLCSLPDQNPEINWSIWIPALISIISLFFNILFYIIIAPKINLKYQKKSELLKIASDFFAYLSDLPSLKSFEGAPTQIRKYSQSIHLMFKNGTAPDNLASILEDLFKSVQSRKNIVDEKEISAWNSEIRNKIRSLRIEIASYTGIF